MEQSRAGVTHWTTGDGTHDRPLALTVFTPLLEFRRLTGRADGFSQLPGTTRTGSVRSNRDPVGHSTFGCLVGQQVRPSAAIGF